jgi:hypothetical protein
VSTPEVPPGWTEQIDRPLKSAVRRVPLLGLATPANAASERARLVAAFASGQPRQPEWRYAALPMSEVKRDLETILTALEKSTHSSLRDIYAARIGELVEEADLCEAIGTPVLAALAEVRFKAPVAEDTVKARALASAWIGEKLSVPESAGVLVRSDDSDPRSLLSRMRAEVGRMCLPFSVVVNPDLSSLAATGERTILIAGGRLLSEETTRRTVLHETQGHAVPRTRASLLAPGIFQVGTARGIDEQEGYALCLESRNDALGAVRRRELAARYVAVEAMRNGASFVETVLFLANTHGVSLPEAILVAERCFRGSDGSFAGLGRERIYLETFLRVSDWLAVHAADERVLASGQISLDSITTLRGFVA